MSKKSYLVTKEELIENPDKLRPHVVILGAGASVAAFQSGDAYGNLLPTMDNLIEITGLAKTLNSAGISFKGRDFELIYSEIYANNPESELIKEIENQVYNYFNNLQTSSIPSLYDHLVLSLREKDVIATFNWDPFLYDSWENISKYLPVPEIIHLHGNVRVGYCPEHRVQGDNRYYCPECDKKLVPSKLLYPITSKNYSDDIFINVEWEVLKRSLEQAFTMTIFGYSAPDSDYEAVHLMENAWKSRSERALETVEIIDIKEPKIIADQWRPFYQSHHYMHFQDFYKSNIARHPRRTCEAIVAPTIYGKFVEDNPLPKGTDLTSLINWFEPLLKYERKLYSKNNS